MLESTNTNATDPIVYRILGETGIIPTIRIMATVQSINLQNQRNPTPVGVGNFVSVELPGIEPGSYVTSPGLLRAQFAQRSLLGPPARTNTSG